MGFLAPWFLAAIAGIALPLWLHLLRRYRATPQPFSSLMFFERRTQSSVRHRRLRYLRLLALRIALLLLLALAFANPFVNRTVAAAGGRMLLVIAVDRSFSMSFADRISKAKSAAANTLANRNNGGQAQVLALDSQVEFLTKPTDDRNEIRAAIQSIAPTDRRSSYASLVRALHAIAATSSVPLDGHFFTDAQQSSMPTDFASLELGPRTQLTIHSAGAPESPNWAVESVTAPARVYDARKHRVRATIAGYQTEAAERQVSLLLDDRVIETKIVPIPAAGRATVEFLTLETPYGFHRGEVRIAPADQLPGDDRFPFSVERSDPRPILFLNAGRGEFYFRTALEAAPDNGFTVESSLTPAAPLSKYALVVLSNPGALPSGLEDSLRQYVNAGGSVFIALGPATALRPRVPVSSETIAESRTTPRTAVVLDKTHPVLAQTGSLDGVQFFQTVRFNPGAGRVLARLSDQSPLLVEKTMGEGRVLIFASTLDNVSNDFPLHTAFVPFIEAAARYLGGYSESASNVSVDSYIELRRANQPDAASQQGAASQQRSAVEVIGPDGKPPLSLAEAAIARTFQLTRAGFYQIRRADGRRQLLAVHADRQESDLATIPPETLALWRNTGGSQTVSASGANQSLPWSLWRYALFAVLAAALLESFFAAKYLAVQKDPA